MLLKVNYNLFSHLSLAQTYNDVKERATSKESRIQVTSDTHMHMSC